ncbi:MAG: hypothetical protein NVS3B10_21760 [Polyangiales bacterium]
MSTASTPPRTHTKRRRSGYLLDPRFQLKWTGLLVGSVLGVTVALGVVLARTASDAAESALIASTQAEKALKESATSAKLLRLTAASYAELDPDLAKTIDRDEDEIDREFARNLAEVNTRWLAVDAQRRRILWLLIGGSVAICAILTALGIFITHRVVGPAHRLKRLLRQVGTAKFDMAVGELRRGDELEDLFETFVQMAWSLRALQAGRLATLDATLVKASAAQVPEDVMRGLTSLRAQLSLGLHPDSHRPRADGAPR